MPYSTKTSFPFFKRNIIEQFEAKKMLDKNKLDYLKKINSRKPFENSMTQMVIGSSYNPIDNPKEEKILDLCYHDMLTPKVEKLWKQIIAIKHKKLCDLLKILTHRDSNLEVMNIKQELKEKYNVKSAYLNNNLEFAKAILESAKILKNNNIPFPENIIVSNFAVKQNLMEYSYAMPERNTIILNPNQFNTNSAGHSTTSKLHIIVHECIHCIQPFSLPLITKKLPTKYDETVRNLSSYAHNNFASEVHAELMTKKILDKLTPDEIKLLKYFEIQFAPKLNKTI